MTTQYCEACANKLIYNLEMEIFICPECNFNSQELNQNDTN